MKLQSVLCRCNSATFAAAAAAAKFLRLIIMILVLRLMMMILVYISEQVAFLTMQDVSRAALLGARCSFDGLLRCSRGGVAVYELQLAR